MRRGQSSRDKSLNAYRETAMARNKFVVDARGRQLYARDRFGREVYNVRGGGNLFARDEHNAEYYARDAEGNEYYPCVNGQTRMIPDKLALYHDGTQRYPADHRGNEFYWSKEGKPYVLCKSDGELYFARNRRGFPLIPWNHVKILDDTPYWCTRDVGGTLVYVHASELPERWKRMCDCLCRCALQCLCPDLLRILLS